MSDLNLIQIIRRNDNNNNNDGRKMIIITVMIKLVAGETCGKSVKKLQMMRTCNYTSWGEVIGDIYVGQQQSLKVKSSSIGMDQ